MATRLPVFVYLQTCCECRVTSFLEFTKCPFYFGSDNILPRTDRITFRLFPEFLSVASDLKYFVTGVFVLQTNCLSLFI